MPQIDKFRALRRRAFLVGLLLIGCSGGGGACGASSAGCGACGGGGCTSIPGGFPQNQKMSNAMTAELSQAGITYIQNNLNQLIGTVLGGGTSGLAYNADAGTITDALGCIMDSQNINIPVIGSQTVNVDVCCNNPSPPCDITVKIDSFTLTPQTASDGSLNMQITVTVDVNTGTLPIVVPIDVLGLNCSIECGADYDQQNIAFPVTVNLNIAQDWSDLLAFNVQLPILTNVISANSLSITDDSSSGFCSTISSGVVCGLLSLNFVTSEIFTLLQTPLQNAITAALANADCQKCDDVQWPDGGCPVSTGATNAPKSSCNGGGYCGVTNSDGSDGGCVPNALGIQDRVDIGNTLAAYGAPTDATLDLYAVAGGENTNGTPTTYKDTAGGITLGLMGGTNSPFPAACVPMVTPPSIATPASLNFPMAAMEMGPAGSTGVEPIPSYMLGVGVASEFINKMLYDVYNSGSLCLEVGTSLTSLLSTALFQGTLTTSLATVTHGLNEPMLVVLRPHNPPVIQIGLGTEQEVNGMTVPLDPLLSITMKQMQIDFYAFIEDRYVRFVSLTMDIDNLTVGLDFDGTANTVTPLLGSLSDAISPMNITSGNCKMLDSSDCNFGSVVGTLLGLVQGPLNTALANPIAIPSFDGVKLEIDSARGAEMNTTGSGYQQLALFASLAIAPHMSRPRGRTQAKLTKTVMPVRTDIVGKDHVQPYAIVQASVLGGSSKTPMQFAYRVDHGAWSGWTLNPALEVHSPLFLLQSKHLIEIASRAMGETLSGDPSPAPVEFVVNYDPPKVQFKIDSDAGKLVTHAVDLVWQNQITYSYSVDGSGWSAPGPAQTFDLAELSQHKSVEVQVTNGSGLIGTATYGTPRMHLTGDFTAAATQPGASAATKRSGCSQGGIPAATALLLAALVLTRRRKTA